MLLKAKKFSYTIKDVIFKPTMDVIENLQKDPKIKSTIVGGVAVQTYMEDENYLRDTSDVDIIVSVPLKKKDFKKWARPIADKINEKYENWNIIARTPNKCKGGVIDICNEENILQIHIPFYPKKYWKAKKDDVLNIIDNSQVKNIWNHQVKVASLEDTITSKIHRLKIKTRFKDDYLINLIEENKEKIISNPTEWKRYINDLRRELGEAYDDNNGVPNPRTKVVRDALSISKDIYDIITIGYTYNMMDRIKEKILKIKKQDIIKKV